MQMTLRLNDEEIQEAIGDYILAHGAETEGKRVIITLIAGRGENGNSATVEIKPMEEEKVPEKKTRKKRAPKEVPVSETKVLGKPLVTGGDANTDADTNAVQEAAAVDAKVEEKTPEPVAKEKEVEAKATVQAPPKGKSLFGPKG